ncbi:Uncharacterised protein [Dermatophilus congolensis]|uniref:Uncharacterized protein n=1 Tax=Dermatophilus congolensis TaxID=1863 RepID=A0AA46BQE3_9MICO|nr:hypothetical protein [Dermatophilus congolensis]STD15494.1 Uncharacterised protein [Dermatophilus congolensis]
MGTTPRTTTGIPDLARAILTLTGAWLLAIGTALLASPNPSFITTNLMTSLLLSTWPVSPIITGPVLIAWWFRSRKHPHWWRARRRQFATINAAVLLACALAVGILETIPLLATTSNSSPFQPLIGMCLWLLWSGQIFWTPLLGALIGPQKTQQPHTDTTDNNTP